MTTPDPLLTATEVAAELRVDVRTVYGLLRTRKLRPEHRGPGMLSRPHSLEVGHIGVIVALVKRELIFLPVHQVGACVVCPGAARDVVVVLMKQVVHAIQVEQSIGVVEQTDAVVDMERGSCVGNL